MVPEDRGRLFVCLPGKGGNSWKREEKDQKRFFCFTEKECKSLEKR
jgi:hypothetical protein